MRSTLFEQSNVEREGDAGWIMQNSKMLKVQLGTDVLASKGVMVAYQGHVKFNHESSGSVKKLLKKVLTNEDTPLMRCTGQGDVFFARRAEDVFIIQLENDAITVEGHNLLAFDAAVQWDIRRVRGAGIMSGGFYNVELSGAGQVALTCDGPPMILDCSQQPTYVDIQAAVCWSANLQPEVVSSMNFKSMLRGGSGEAFQYSFHGPGFVVVQPSEGQDMMGSGSSGDGGSHNGNQSMLGGLFD